MPTPRIVFDYDQVLRMSRLFSTDKELAYAFGCSSETISRRKKDDPEFAKAYNDGRAEVIQGLRRAQWASALGGNPTMMIWLGKQHLGQKNEVHIEMDIEERRTVELRLNVNDLGTVLAILDRAGALPIALGAGSTDEGAVTTVDAVHSTPAAAEAASVPTPGP